MQSDFCVSQKERVISQLCYLSTYCYVFYFWSPWVPVACPKFACRRTQIYAHAGVHMCRNNTVDNISANRNVWYTSAHWVTGENTHTHTHTCMHAHTHTDIMLLGFQQPVIQGANISLLSRDDWRD